MIPIGQNLVSIKEHIHQTEIRFQRPKNSVKLVAVSKKQPVSAIQAAIDAGHRIFGESYLQEALPKMAELIGQDLEWHFIGPIQSNKTRGIAAHFDWVHSVSSLKQATRLNDQRPKEYGPLNICLQYNSSEETSKSGADATELVQLSKDVSELPGLRLRGLMAIPVRSHDLEEQRAQFRRVRDLYDALKQTGLELDTLSMGMSGDLDAAIAEGATIVRVGTGIFGQRKT